MSGSTESTVQFTMSGNSWPLRGPFIRTANPMGALFAAASLADRGAVADEISTGTFESH